MNRKDVVIPTESVVGNKLAASALWIQDNTRSFGQKSGPLSSLVFTRIGTDVWKSKDVGHVCRETHPVTWQLLFNLERGCNGRAFRGRTLKAESRRSYSFCKAMYSAMLYAWISISRYDLVYDRKILALDSCPVSRGHIGNLELER